MVDVDVDQVSALVEWLGFVYRRVCRLDAGGMRPSNPLLLLNTHTSTPHTPQVIVTAPMAFAVLIAVIAQFLVGYNTSLMNAPEAVVFPG